MRAAERPSLTKYSVSRLDNFSYNLGYFWHGLKLAQVVKFRKCPNIVLLIQILGETILQKL